MCKRQDAKGKQDLRHTILALRQHAVSYGDQTLNKSSKDPDAPDCSRPTEPSPNA